MDDKKEPRKFNFSTLRSFATSTNQQGLTSIKSTSTYAKVTDARIDSALSAQSAVLLRSIASDLRLQSGDFSRLEQYFSRLLTCNFVAVPTDYESVLNSNFAKNEKKILDYVKSASIESTTMEIIKTVVTEGVFYGYEMDLNGEKTFMKLPAEYCRSRFKVKGLYTLEVDLRMYQQYRGDDLIEALEASPPELSKAYEDYVAGRLDTYWYMADYTLSRVHYLDPKMYPMLSSVFYDVVDLMDGKGKDRINDNIKLKNIISQLIPVDENGEITLEMEDITELHQNAVAMVGDDDTDIVTTPCKLELLSARKTESANAESISEREKKNLHAAAGTNSALLGGESKGSVGLEKSIDADAALIYPILLQSTEWYNMKFSTLTKIPFEIIFSPATNMTRNEWYKIYKEAASNGYPTKLLAGAVLGIPQNAMAGMLAYENRYLNLVENMEPNKTSYTEPAAAPGAPTKTEVTEEGLDTQVQDKNA